MTGHHLVQLNVGRMLAAPESPIVAEFFAALEPLNALADTSPGFVWRLQTEAGDATAIHAFDDDLMLVNMSVWETLAELWRYVYSGDHLAVMRRRREWFEVAEVAYLALWWIPAGEIPTVEQAVARLETIRRLGPTPAVFTFKHPYDAAGDRLDPATIRTGAEPARCA